MSLKRLRYLALASHHSLSPHRAENWLDLLGNRHRRRIIQLCSVRPLYPQKIAEILGISVPAVIKHLQELEKNNIVMKKTEPREEGGRELQYYYVPFRPRFNFNLSNDDLVEIDIVDESNQEIPSTSSRKKIIDVNSLNKEEISSIREKSKSFIDLEHERIELSEKFRKLHENQRNFFRSIRKENSQQQVIFKILRFLLDRYGFEISFSKADFMTGLGIDEESADEIIELLSTHLNIISKTFSDQPSQSENWKINSFTDQSQMDYN